MNPITREGKYKGPMTERKGFSGCRGGRSDVDNMCNMQGGHVFAHDNRMRRQLKLLSPKACPTLARLDLVLDETEKWIPPIRKQKRTGLLRSASSLGLYDLSRLDTSGRSPVIPYGLSCSEVG